MQSIHLSSEKVLVLVSVAGQQSSGEYGYDILFF